MSQADPGEGRTIRPTSPSRTERGFALAAGIILLFGAVGVVSAGKPAARPAEPNGASSSSVIVTGSLPLVLRHVILVVEENHDLAWTLTDPVFHTLYTAHAHATHAWATCHPSAPNYLALTSAEKLQCGSDGVSYYTATNLASELSAHGYSWQGLFDSMPKACDRSDAYPYIAHHNPWVYYSDLKSTCARNDLPFSFLNGTSRLQSELTSGTLPNFVFVAPNMRHDAHDGTLSAASGWLNKNVLGPVASSLKYANSTAVLVIFDEAYKKSCGCAEGGGYSSGGVTVSGGPVYLIAVSPLSPPTKVVTANVTDFNVVTTVEWVFGLPSLGHHDTSSFPALRGLL